MKNPFFNFYRDINRSMYYNNGLRTLVVCCIILLLFGSNGVCREKSKKESKNKSVDLVLESANSNENTYSNGEFVSVLNGNVVFSFDDIRIRSDEATWWRSQGKVSFRNNIKATRQRSSLTCNQLNFNKNKNILIASGNFHFTDTTDKTELFGNEAEYHIDTEYFILKDKPKLIRYDSIADDTLTITGEKMTYLDSLKKATVLENVVIRKGDLSSKCNYAHFYTDKNLAQLRTGPEVQFLSNKITGDSINLTFGKKNLKSASIVGRSHGVYIDTSGVTKDTTFTHIWGDSLYMSVSDSGDLDSLWSFGKAQSKYYLSSRSNYVDEASGKKMMMSFATDGNVDNVKIWGNAKSKYHIDEDKSSGTNEASGDSITVKFHKGKATQLTLTGRSRGKYYPRDL